jgi:hypothetical protein
MAQIRILLIPEHREYLLACLPAGSEISAISRDAAEARSSGAFFDDNYEILCDEEDAYVLVNTRRKAVWAPLKELKMG